MRLSIAVAAALAGCSFNAIDLPGPSAVDCEEGPWSEATVAQTRAATLVAATRRGCGFHDETIEYRVYRVAKPWILIAESSMPTEDWRRAIMLSGDRYTLRLDGR